ncbi:MAG: condensation domain-containing protein [Smithella sp.]|nr:condensation domain-containing protein [Smithella sp.]
MIIHKHRLSEGREIPLSFPQQRIWFLQNLYNDHVMYNVGRCYRVKGLLDMEALRTALYSLAVRHEPLRSRLQFARDGYPFQIIEKDPQFDIEYTDLRNHHDDDISGTAGQMMQEALVRPFNLCHDNMLRVVSVKLSNDESMLMFVIHHIISDYVSRRIFNAELTALYAAMVTGKTLALPPLTFQYSEFVKKQERLLSGENIASRHQYWRDFFAGCTHGEPPLGAIPQHNTNDVTPSYESLQQIIAPDTISQCKIIADQEKSTLFTIVLAAITLLVGHLYRNSRVILCIANANRQVPGAEQLIGCFFTNIIISLNIQPDLKINEMLREIRSRFLNARQHQDMPFEMFAEDLNMECTARRQPPYKVYISYRKAADIDISLPDADLERFDVATGKNTHEDIVFNFWERLSDGEWILDVEWLWRSDVFDKATIKRASTMLDVLLKRIGNSVQTNVRNLQKAVTDIE